MWTRRRWKQSWPRLSGRLERWRRRWIQKEETERQAGYDHGQGCGHGGGGGGGVEREVNLWRRMRLGDAEGVSEREAERKVGG
eukprot:7886636-Alexandrium_andersonii.AAC.1